MARAKPARALGSTTRRGIARDTLTILGGALLAVVAAQLTMSVPAGATGSPTAPDTGEVIGGDSQDPGPTFPPIETIGQIVNPSVHLEATPTPIPIITLGPPTPSPSVPPSPGPSASVKPTPRPTATHKATPSPAPTPTASPTSPPLIASFSCSPAENGGPYVGGVTVTCTDASTGATGWTWDYGDGTTDTGQSPSPHLYALPGSYTITLTITGPGAPVQPSTSRCCWSVSA
jgi:outer membrane biosynthesis protein TonB